MNRVEREEKWALAKDFVAEMDAEPGRWLQMPPGVFVRGPEYAALTEVTALDPWRYDVYQDADFKVWARRKPRPEGVPSCCRVGDVTPG